MFTQDRAAKMQGQLQRPRHGPMAGSRAQELAADLVPQAALLVARTMLACHLGGNRRPNCTSRDAPIQAVPQSVSEVPVLAGASAQQWYFGMKLHIGVDSGTGLAHSAPRGYWMAEFGCLFSVALVDSSNGANEENIAKATKSMPRPFLRKKPCTGGPSPTPQAIAAESQ